MATSDVRRGLDNIVDDMGGRDAETAQALAQLTSVEAEYAEYATRYADVRTEALAYVPTGAFEEGAKDEYERLEVEFQAKRVKVQTAIAALVV